MKKFLLIFLSIVSLFSCASDDTENNNPNLPSIGFTYQINLDLPEYNSLKFPGNEQVINIQGVGINGVVVYNVDNTLYTAFEISDPNIPLSDCSVLTINGIEATSDCDNDNVYNIITGQQTQGTGGFPLLAYQVRRDGNTITVSN
ncbi:hypothetical protein [Aquimarina addita]